MSSNCLLYTRLDFNQPDSNINMGINLSQIICKTCYLASVKQPSLDNSTMYVNIVWNFTNIIEDGYEDGPTLSLYTLLVYVRWSHYSASFPCYRMISFAKVKLFGRLDQISLLPTFNMFKKCSS